VLGSRERGHSFEICAIKNKLILKELNRLNRNGGSKNGEQ
jgi:hypothetical protein